MGRMLRNLVGVKPDVRNDDLKRYVSFLGSSAQGSGSSGRVTDTELLACTNDLRSESSLTAGQVGSASPRGIRPRAAFISIAHRSTPFSIGYLFDLLILTRMIQVVLADKYEQYQMTYEGCHVFNPGTFVGNSYGFSTYNPARRESEAS